MRIADRVALIEKATNDSGQIELQVQSRLNNQEYEILNWTEIHTALDEIIRRGWLTGQEAQTEQYVRDMVETRPPTQQLVLNVNQYQALNNSIQTFCRDLPQALRILKAESTQDESWTSVFTVEIGEFNSLDEAADRIAEVFNIFGRSLNVDHQPSFVGMDSGSNYLMFNADNEITKWAISVAIQLAEALREHLQGLASPSNIRTMAAWFRQAMGDRFQSEDDDVESVREARVKSFHQQAREPLIQEVKEKFPDQQELGNESLNQIQVAVPQILEMLEKGATFQRPENDDTSVTNVINVINVYGGTVNVLPESGSQGQLPEGSSKSDE